MNLSRPATIFYAVMFSSPQIVQAAEVTRSCGAKELCSVAAQSLTASTLATRGNVRARSLSVARSAVFARNLTVDGQLVDQNGSPITTGPTGPQGPQGPVGTLAYAYVYHTGGPLNLDTLDAIPFNHTGPISTGLSHDDLINPERITLDVAGLYLIKFSVTVSAMDPDSDSPQFAVLINGVPPPVASTVYGTNLGTSVQITGQSLVTVPDNNSYVSICSTSTATAGFFLTPQVGGTQTNVNAAVFILRLA